MLLYEAFFDIIFLLRCNYGRENRMILDNKQNGLVGDTLKKYLFNDASLSIVTNTFCH